MKEYRNDQIIVYWYPELCSHSGKCLRFSPKVFRESERPWVDINGEAPEGIIQTIDSCPSGALKYSLPPGSAVDPSIAKGVGSVDHEKDNPPAVKIRVINNGPLLIEGAVEINGPDGKPLKEGSRFVLCRCGLTGNRPFCDNTHHKQGWNG
ncbi:MAG: hypothetical protein HPY50_19610 [Firmicutes bacterium]|nr:hypothetical protein [Bacillota bacterium]